MSWIKTYLRSSIGAKHIMAVTGIGLVLFVLQHMVANLQVFLGPDRLNAYAHGLQSLGGLLWVARAGLLAITVLHVWAALRLVTLNRQARPQRYAVFRPQRTPFYARVMPQTGLIVLAFIVYHLLHFTTGTIMPGAHALQDAQGRHDVYSMVVLGFQNPLVAVSYMVAMALLCMHLAHGASSIFQTLGASHPKYNGLFQKCGPVLAAVIFVGNVSMPAAVLAGFIKLPGV
jgi:succinate dehydrogenase / fumarate reductase cytochrome b subunit